MGDADGFLPDPADACALRAALCARLAESLEALAAACSGDARVDGSIRQTIQGLQGGSTPCGLTMARYHEALAAGLSENAPALARTLGALSQVRGATGTMQVRNFGEAGRDPADWARLARVLLADPTSAVVIEPVPDALMRQAADALARARAALAAAEPALAAEIDALVREVVFAQPVAGSVRGFGGATAFAAWSTILLNAQRHQSLIAAAGGLVHEAAHTVLLGRSMGLPLVGNDPAERYPSPLRADARPMDGIVHAAFVSARMAYAMDRLLAWGGLDSASRTEAEQARAAATAAFAAGHGVVAAHARLTPAGARAMAGALSYMQAAHRCGRVAEAALLYRGGQYQAAAEMLEPLAAGQGAPADLLSTLGLCRLQLGSIEAARAVLARAHALAPDDPRTQMHYGLALRAAGQPEAAAALFRCAARLLATDAAPWLNLSATLLDMADPHAAIAAARRGRLRHNGSASHYTLGVACLAAGQYARAAASFAQAVRHAPGFVDGWINLGVAQYRDGRIEPAKQAMRAALAIAPDHPAACANLGGFLHLSGEIEEAEALLSDLVTRCPQAAAARLNLAVILLGEDRARAALDLLEGGPSGGPARAPEAAALAQHWALQQALALIKLGRHQQARLTLRAIGPVSPELAPLLHWREALLAQAEGDSVSSRRAAAHMAAGLACPSMLPEHRIMGHYDLAKYWSGANQPEAAFHHWREGHRLLGQMQPFSRVDYAAFVDATIATFSAERLQHGARAGNRDAAPVFVVGMPRSGTTLMEHILSAHPRVHGAGERPALALMAARLGGPIEGAASPARIADRAATVLDDAAASYLGALHELAPDADRVVDKMPGNFRHLGLVGLMLPGARIIACERDPRDVGLSIFTYRFYGMHAYAHDLSDLGWYIGQQHRLMAHWRAALPNPVLSVQLADWSRDFSGTLRRVLAFLDLPYDAACEQFFTNTRRVRTVSRAQVQRPVNTAGIGRWQTYAAQLAPLLAALEQAGVMPGAERAAA